MMASNSPTTTATASTSTLQPHEFMAHPILPKKETCRACFEDVQARRTVIERASDLKPKVKREQLMKKDKQLKSMFWEASKRTAERNRHLAYCRFTAPLHRARARRKLNLPLDSKDQSVLAQADKADTKTTKNNSTAGPFIHTAAFPATDEGQQRVRRAAAAKRARYKEVGSDEEYAIPDEDNLYGKPPVAKKSKTRTHVEPTEESGDESSSVEDADDFEHYFAPRAKSGSETLTSVSISSEPPPVKKSASIASSLSEGPNGFSRTASTLPPNNRELPACSPRETSTINRIEGYVRKVLARHRDVVQALTRDQAQAAGAGAAAAATTLDHDIDEDEKDARREQLGTRTVEELASALDDLTSFELDEGWLEADKARVRGIAAIQSLQQQVAEALLPPPPPPASPPAAGSLAFDIKPAGIDRAYSPSQGWGDDDGDVQIQPFHAYDGGASASAWD